MAPECEQKVIGIRPGEKLHEIMVPEDEARQTSEFDNFFIIQPTMYKFNIHDRAIYDGETGNPVSENFKYSSDSNDQWLSKDDLLGIIK
jgi:UDP-N-acetylglucosamine 4,6-dehydratase